MTTFVALLRGINVGGHNRIAMADLRDVVADLGHRDVATYVGSGNVVLTSDRTDGEQLGSELADAVRERLGVAPAVLVRPAAELEEVVAANPYPGEPDPKKVHAVFLPAPPDDDARRALATALARAADRGSRDEAQVVGRVLYLHTPDGFGRSVLADLLARGAGSSGTARNWATVTKLLEMCRTLGG
ncbi:DUF1697 domain-containing protein [Georgenia sp. EYE_87]|uniref:DUF1697 domain-containing protein n=1 Tax=Georgenia sp. EYE_87 TaxID=2853448 RepID=UPI002003A986|nr:DUF1697 domain-containing protein [Georgenia sp. EYE_87]MCK6212014.1 DUF1697 domain-containing protein [Georgenia sp. EYE_87]